MRRPDWVKLATWFLSTETDLLRYFNNVAPRQRRNKSVNPRFSFDDLSSPSQNFNETPAG
jgi:hypothetical protein